MRNKCHDFSVMILISAKVSSPVGEKKGLGAMKKVSKRHDRRVNIRRQLEGVGEKAGIVGQRLATLAATGP